MTFTSSCAPWCAGASRPRWAPLTAAGIRFEEGFQIQIDDLRIALSPREHALLAYLARRPREVVTRAEILQEVFGYAFDPGSNVIDVYLTHLRRKLSRSAIRIETVRRAGFRLELAR